MLHNSCVDVWNLMLLTDSHWNDASWSAQNVAENNVQHTQEVTVMCTKPNTDFLSVEERVCSPWCWNRGGGRCSCPDLYPFRPYTGSVIIMFAWAFDSNGDMSAWTLSEVSRSERVTLGSEEALDPGWSWITCWHVTWESSGLSSQRWGPLLEQLCHTVPTKLSGLTSPSVWPQSPQHHCS